MSMHSSKGLEFKNVFICCCEEGVIPHRRSMGENGENVDEERRLFYVAASRAKENLFITMPTYLRSWDAVFNKSSRFLAEIDRGCYELEK